MNDLGLVIAGIAFFFILWLYSGGPQHPLSFAGPYLTPITDISSEPIGYGDSDAEYADASELRAATGNIRTIDTAKSPFAGSVRMAASAPQRSAADSEYLLIRSEAGAPVRVSGWQIVAAGSGTQVRIPSGTHTQARANGEIILAPGEYLTVVTGSRSDASESAVPPSAWTTYLGQKHELWALGNETLTLLDENGKVVDQYRY